jgi:hypothetical protein
MRWIVRTAFSIAVWWMMLRRKSGKSQSAKGRARKTGLESRRHDLDPKNVEPPQNPISRGGHAQTASTMEQHTSQCLPLTNLGLYVTFDFCAGATPTEDFRRTLADVLAALAGVRLNGIFCWNSRCSEVSNDSGASQKISAQASTLGPAYWNQRIAEARCRDRILVLSAAVNHVRSFSFPIRTAVTICS